MVSDVIVPPAGVADAVLGAAGWAAVVDDLESRPPLRLPHLTIVPPVQPVGAPAATTVRIWDVLDAWRATERQLAGIPSESPDWPRVHADVVGLRAAYHRLFHQRLQPTNHVLRVAGKTLIVWR